MLQDDRFGTGINVRGMSLIAAIAVVAIASCALGCVVGWCIGRFTRLAECTATGGQPSGAAGPAPPQAAAPPQAVAGQPIQGPREVLGAQAPVEALRARLKELKWMAQCK